MCNRIVHSRARTSVEISEIRLKLPEETTESIANFIFRSIGAHLNTKIEKTSTSIPHPQLAQQRLAATIITSESVLLLISGEHQDQKNCSQRSRSELQTPM